MVALKQYGLTLPSSEQAVPQLEKKDQKIEPDPEPAPEPEPEPAAKQGKGGKKEKKLTKKQQKALDKQQKAQHGRNNKGMASGENGTEQGGAGGMIQQALQMGTHDCLGELVYVTLVRPLVVKELGLGGVSAEAKTLLAAEQGAKKGGGKGGGKKGGKKGGGGGKKGASNNGLKMSKKDEILINTTKSKITKSVKQVIQYVNSARMRYDMFFFDLSNCSSVVISFQVCIFL